MAFPNNPLTIVVKNKYYSNGLTEGKVYDYYIRNKNNIIKEINYRPVLLFIYTDVNKWVIKRNLKGSSVYIDKFNYNEIITGRTVSLSVERGSKLSYLCVDVDPGQNVREEAIKQAVRDVSKSSISALSKRLRIVNTSTGYHVYFYLKKPLPVETAYKILNKALSIDFRDKYILGGKPPKSNEIKLDTSTSRNRGSHVLVGGLCRNGLKCMDITKTFESFDRKKAILK